MLTYQEIVEGLVEIEQNFDVTSLKIDDVHVWPLIRRHLGDTLVWKTYNPTKKGNSKNWRLQRSSNYLNYQAQRAKIILKKIKDIYNFDPKLSSKKDINTQAKTNILFVSRPEDNTDDCNGLIYNRHIDPFIELAEAYRLKWLKIEEIKQNDLSEQYYYPPKYYGNTKSYSYLNTSRRLSKITNFSDFISCKQKFFSHGTEDLIVYDETIYEYERILARKNYFTQVLRKANPKIAFIVCYYSNETLPIVWACKELNIVTVDIQHGKQGEYHQMYSHWTKFPEKGYSFLPDYFWNWGAPSCENIGKWHPAKLSTHLPIAGGNLWLAKWKHGDTTSFENQHKSFLNEIEQKKSLILLTLQPLPNPLEDFILQAIKNTEADFYWLIRLHPKQRNKIEQIENSLKKYNIANYEIKNSTYVPLYSLLKRVDLHITSWSSTSIEALYFDKHTIITHLNGKNLYREYIEKDYFSLALDYEVLLEKIYQCAFKLVNTSDDYIQTEETVYKKAFLKLLEQVNR